MGQKIGVFSFFAGAGFLDLGFESTDRFMTLFVNEFQKSFANIYVATRKKMGIPPPEYGYQVADISENLTNFNSIWLNDNIRDAKKHYDVIGFIGGPPCPDFSIAGKNRGKNGENGKLSATYVELICRSKPDFFLFENVKGLYRTIKHRQFFESLKVKLANSGYHMTERLINSIEYGVPQDRERIILIGFRDSLLNDLGKEWNGSHITHDFNWTKNTLHNAKDVFGKNWPQQDDFSPDSLRPVPSGIPIELTVESWFQKNDVYNHANAESYFTPRAGLEKFKVIKEGDDLKKSYKRLHRWRYSPTAAYGNNEVHLHPYKERRISVAEALALQSLPKEFIIPEGITLTDMFKSIGNGVPFLAAQGLAKSIYDFLTENTTLGMNYTHEETISKQYSIVH